jgi:hypothetical protein
MVGGNRKESGDMLDREHVVIESVSPLEGHEGTIVTLRGKGFDTYNPVRNNCVVMGGMGACARAQPGSTSTELKVRIGPVARVQEGDILMWPGLGADLHTGHLAFGKANLRFSETAIFRNGAPVASAGVKFKLTKESPLTYAGKFERAAMSRVELGGHERGHVMCASFPKDAQLSKHKSVDVCIVLKEPTLAIDFTAQISGDEEDCLRAIAKGIAVNASLVGEKVFADVSKNQKTGDFELYVTKPYLQNGMLTVHFGG